MRQTASAAVTRTCRCQVLEAMYAARVYWGGVMKVDRVATGEEERFELQMGGPRVGDSGGARGRSTCSAGDWASTHR